MYCATTDLFAVVAGLAITTCATALSERLDEIGRNLSTVDNNRQFVTGKEHALALYQFEQRDQPERTAMFGMLSAIPKTPLHARLSAEGRLDLGDPPEYGTNVIPARMTGEALRDGYIDVLRRLNEPTAYFDRVDSLYHDRTFSFGAAQRSYRKRHRVCGTLARGKTLLRCAVLYFRLMRRIRDPDLKREYRRRVAAVWQRRHEPESVLIYLIKCAMHYHYAAIIRDMLRSDHPLVNIV